MAKLFLELAKEISTAHTHFIAQFIQINFFTNVFLNVLNNASDKAIADKALLEPAMNETFV